jgi:hypothetical protein
MGWTIPAGATNFSLLQNVHTGSGAHVASYPMGTGGSLVRDEVAGAELQHSPSSSAKVKKEWSCTSTCCISSWCGQPFPF